MSVNKAIIFGNVGNAPEVRDVNGSKVASFRVATSERYKDRNGEQHENVEWHSVVCWRNLAEFVEKYIKKGDKVYVEGKIKSREYTPQDGAKRTIVEIVADKVEPGGKIQKVEQDDMPSDDAPF